MSASGKASRNRESAITEAELERLLHCFGSEPLDFSANINPLGSPPLKDVLSREMEKLGQYPDNKYTEFREAAASFVGVDVCNIVPGNGSSEIIRLFAETTLEEGDLAIIPFPTFGEYENQSRLFGAEIQRTNLGPNGQVEIDDSALSDAKAFFLCNPNNPTGSLLPKSKIVDLAKRCERSETFLLVDEAFIELSDPEQSVVRLAPEMEYLVVMRSLTKSFGVPGLRLGFGVSNNLLTEVMNRARLPWSISSIASAAGVELFKHTDHLEKARKSDQDRACLADGPARGLRPEANGKHGQLHPRRCEAFRPFLRGTRPAHDGRGDTHQGLPILWPGRGLHKSCRQEQGRERRA